LGKYIKNKKEIKIMNKSNQGNASMQTILLAVLIMVVVIQGFFMFQINNRLVSVHPEVQRGEPAHRLPEPSSTHVVRRSTGYPGLREEHNDEGWNAGEKISQFENQVGQMVNRAVGAMGGKLGNRHWDGSDFAVLDVKDAEDKFLVKMHLPGVDKNNIKVKLEKNLLVVQAKQEESMEEKDATGKVVRSEVLHRDFLKSFSIPHNLKTDSMESDYEDDVLKIKFKKKQ
jgi:HSP20 family protein